MRPGIEGGVNARAKKKKMATVRRRVAVTIVLEVEAPADTGVSFADIDDAVSAAIDREWPCPAPMYDASDEAIEGYTVHDLHVERVEDAGEAA